MSPLLPDDTYTATLVSGSGVNGFLDALEAGLDGANNGGHANYITNFTTSYQHNATPALGIPDFARGPDSNSRITVPNSFAYGIPITLYNAVQVTDVTFTLSYNPALLNISDTLTGPGSNATDPNGTFRLVSATGGVAFFSFHDATPQSGTVVLGDIQATVPNSAAGSYKAKELLQFGTIFINNGTVTGAAGAGAVHVNAYLGDVNGDGIINGLDTLTANAVANGTVTGFAAYPLVDPVVIGDVGGDLSVDAGDVTSIDAFSAGFYQALIPMPPGLTIIPAANSADPTLSLGKQLNGAQRGVSLPVVSVLLDHPHPAGSTGLTEAILALTYDPAVLSVSPSDITFGAIPSQGTGWQLLSQIDQTTGQIAIELYSLTPITATQSGSLVNIAFNVLGNEWRGVSSPVIPATAVQLVDSVTPFGHRFETELADSLGALLLSPALDRFIVGTGITAVSLVAPVSMASVETATANPQVPIDGLDLIAAQGRAETVSLFDGFETKEAFVVLSNVAVPGETVHNVLTGLIVAGALAVQTNSTMQPAGQLFQIGNWPLSNMLLYQSSPAQIVVNRLFQAMARMTDAPVDQNLLELLRNSVDNLTWDSLTQNWLHTPSQFSSFVSPNELDAADVDRQGANQQTGAYQNAVVERLFADLANEMDDFNDLK